MYKNCLRHLSYLKRERLREKLKDGEREGEERGRQQSKNKYKERWQKAEDNVEKFRFRLKEIES